LGYATGFVVATDEVNSVRISKLQAYEKGDGFDAEETSIDIITYAEK